jgi:uncharacterized protein YgiM (DUF1202 family)
MTRYISIAAFALLFSACSFAQSVQRSSNLRDSPNTRGVLLDTLRRSTKVKLRSSHTTNGYSLVRSSDGKSGWVLARNVSTVPSENVEIMAAPPLVHAQASTDRFAQSCTDPAFPSADTTPIDSECPVEGTGSQPDEAQNSVKNNFCATGHPNSTTLIAAHTIALNAVMVSHDGALAHHKVFLEEMLKNS